MSRRSGLGRGLAALIPPSTDQGEQAVEPPAERGRSSSPAADDGDRSVGHLRQPPSTASATAGSGVEPDEPDRHPSSSGPDTAGGAGAGAGPAPGTVMVLEVSPERIEANPRQPREVFDPDELEGLATSLTDVGMLQPLVVRPLGEDRYELVAGERRLRAARLAGLATVPVLVRHTEDGDLLKEALVENIHRVQLNPLEEGAAYQQLLDEFGVTQEELARRLGRSRPAIANSIRILQLPPAIQRRVAAGVLSAGHAKALLALPDAAVQVRIAERIVAEGLSVRATEELVRLRALDDHQPRSRRPPVAVPGLVDLQDDLSDALQARVRITMGAKRGKLSVEFASVDDLERIVAVIADGLGTRGAQVATSGARVPPTDGDPPVVPPAGPPTG